MTATLPAGEPVDAAGPVAPSRSVRAANRLPEWMGSIRFRLTVIWSSMVFGIALILVGVIYAGLSRSLGDEELYQRVTVVQPVPGGVVIEERWIRDQYRALEQMTNQRALDLLREYSIGGLGGMFLISLGVGWVVSGVMLRPIHRITSVARHISATDLSERIDLGGPHDELRELADTFDDMLGRIDDAFESQRHFIHEASHELRNPLAVIRTNLEVTLADPGADAAEYRETLEVVQRSTERMSRLVDDLLVYARKGQLSLERHTIDAAELVDGLAQEFRAPAEARGIRLVDAASPGLWVDGDRHALRQAVANLLANAVRLAPAGTEVRLRAGREGPWVWISVEDQGPGIAAEDQERVFQRFWRGDPSEGRTEGRSGLGLTIVRQVAEAHGGEVRLVSEPGHGAAFALWLPAVPAPGAAPGDPAPSAGRESTAD